MAASPAPMTAVVDGASSRSVIGPLWRAFLPSFPDLLFVALLFWLFAGGPYGWSGLLVDGDTGWHIRTGEYILDHYAVPRADLFSFSKAGQPWFAWEWGSDVVFALCYRLGGLRAVVLLAGVLICFTLTLLFWRCLQDGVNLFVALAMTVVAAGAASIHYLARPHLFTLLFVTLSMWLLDRDRRRPTPWVWVLLPVTVVWTNLHGGFLALIASMCVLALGAALEGAWLERTFSAAWRRSRRYVALSAACASLTLLNPYGWLLHAHVARYLTSDWIRSAVAEFQSPSFRSENVFQYEILLLGGVAVAGAFLVRKRFGEGLLILFWAHMSLVSARHIPIYALVASPWIAAELQHWWDGAAARAGKKSVLAILRQVSDDISIGQRRIGLMPILIVLMLPVWDRSARWPKDFPAARFPTQAVEKHTERIRQARLLTTDQWADYLIFRFYPQHKVFVDGRSDFYGKEIGQQYLALWTARHDWRDLLKQWNFDGVLIPTEWPLASVLKMATGWKAIYDDGRAIFFVREGGGTGGVFHDPGGMRTGQH